MYRSYTKRNLFPKIGTALLVVSFVFVMLQVPELNAQSLVEKARKEGKVVVYGSLALSHARVLFDKFEEKFPFVKVEYYRQKSDKILMKTLLEVKAGRYLADVYLIDILGAYQLKQKGLLMKYISPESERYPQSFKDPDGLYTAFVVQLYPIGYNTKLVSPEEAPRSYNDLLNPKWKGQLAMDLRNYKWFATVLDYMGEEEGTVFMKRLAGQNLKYYSGHTLLAQLLTAGEFPITVTIHKGTAETMKQEGAPIEWVAAKPTACMIKPVAISSKAPYPNAAKLLYDFILSKEGEKVMIDFNRPTLSTIPKGLNMHFMNETLFPRLSEFVKQFNEIFLKERSN